MCETGYVFDKKLFACLPLVTTMPEDSTSKFKGNQITAKYEIEHELIRTWIINAFENMFNPVVICVIFD